MIGRYHRAKTETVIQNSPQSKVTKQRTLNSGKAAPEVLKV